MAQLTVSLPSLVMTSSSVDTSTQTITGVDISDAIMVSGFINGTTTAPGFLAQVCFTSESTGAFATMVQFQPLTTAAGNGTGGSTGAIPIYLTSMAFTIPNIAAKQFRIASSGVTSTGVTAVLAKSLHL